MQTATPIKNPLTWVPSGYFTMALTYNLLTAAAVILFNNLGMDNAKAAAYASMLGIAYTVKPFFAAFLEMYKSKKFFVLATQIIQGVGYLAIAGIMHLPNYISLMMGLFWILSFIGSTQDITSDGVYVTSLDAKTQAKYCGVQSFSWNLGKLFMMSAVVASTGYLHEYVFKHDPHVTGVQWVDSWQVIFAFLGAFMFLAALWHWKFMPEGSRADHAPNNASEALNTLMEAFVSFFQKKGIWLMIAFALLFRVSYGFLLAPSMLFMKDSAASGGLMLTNQEFGLLYGTFGLAANIVGSLIGGFYVAKVGLKKALFPLCCCVNIPNVTFLLLSIYRPTDYSVISAGVVVEQLFFGIGSVGFMIYLMQQMAPGKFATAHYAFGTGLMALCMILTGMVSGYLQEKLGYVGYFVFVMIATIPSFIICWLAPFHVKHDEEYGVKTE
ncbi:MAG: MFS transporter [Steroidobacter sp.]